MKVNLRIGDGLLVALPYPGVDELVPEGVLVV